MDRFLQVGSRSLVLNLPTPRDGGHLLRMVIYPRWPHGLDNKPSHNYPIDRNPDTLHRNERGHNTADCI